MVTKAVKKTAPKKPAAKKAAKARAAKAPKPLFMRVARPDPPDSRDRPFRPNVARAPAATLFPSVALPVKNQGDTMACTGFGLSLVVEHLLRAGKRETAPAISAFMLYSMARRYDEFPGSVQDKGSSLRGALKGWFKHGACREVLFPALDMPPASKKISEDWWFDAVKRPLGAYYRIDTQSLTDMHAALNEVGIIYASCGCHTGWDEGQNQPGMKRRPASFKEVWEIPVQGGHAEHPGHAFAIVGYNERGFLVQNSWGPEWGSHGYAILTYDDWLRNAMDCWVAQLGVVTRDHTAISQAISLRTDAAGRVALAADEVLRNREISPFIVNMGNNGALSNSGVFRTTPDDVRALVDVHLAQARKTGGLDDGVVDVCIYAHGGLVGESKAADIAAKWIPMLYDRKVFPIFLMWETDFFSTLLNCIEDAVKDVPRSIGGGFNLKGWWNQRLERLLARPGTRIWGEMKQNADAMSAYKPEAADDEQAGGVLLYRHFKHGVANKKIRMHFVGHSAGSIVAAFMIDRLAQEGMKFESVSFMAPAVKLSTFDERLRPHLESGTVKRYQQFHLSDHAEQDDGSCGPYRRSLLYLVSESFEGGVTTPVLGMEKFFDPYVKKLPHTTAFVAPGAVSAATTHGGFDDDPGTQAQVVRFILGK
ncbi:MAG TPA: C1 family peptidase [Rhizobacter sp.]|nr:C1 family peptidase [Rhizobacter sp.]